MICRQRLRSGSLAMLPWRMSKKSRIISVVCILDGTFLLWAWSQHPLGGVLKNLQSNNAVLAEQTGIHTDNNTRHQQLIEEERKTLEAANAKLSETQQSLAQTEQSIRKTNGMTREQLVQIAGQVEQLAEENRKLAATREQMDAVLRAQNGKVSVADVEELLQSVAGPLGEKLAELQQQLHNLAQGSNGVGCHTAVSTEVRG